MSELPIMPPELAALYQEERAAGGPPDADRHRIRVALGTTLALGAGVTVSTATTTATAGVLAGTTTKLVIVMVVVSAFGAGVARLLDSGSVAPRQVPSHVTLSEPASPSDQSEASLVVPQPLAVVVPPVIATPPVARPERSRKAVKRVSTATKPTIAGQRVLLMRAWAAYARGNYGDALAVIETDAAAHADGAFAEEREALHAHLLYRLGRLEEAQHRATAFARRYPTSIHTRLVTQPLQRTSP